MEFPFTPFFYFKVQGAGFKVQGVDAWI